jgi:conjugative relaxase-like TrwC/TraI family protein
MSGGAGYAQRHLEHSDYYDEHRRVQGEWHGRGAELLGLRGEVAQKQFEAVREGLHPETGEFLRPRHSADRMGEDGNEQSKGRSLYDLTFSAPKSVSVQTLVGGDERLVAAHDKAVRETLAEAESHSATRVRLNGANEDRTTANWIVATYRHDTSRELDPQLHTHAVAANLTFDGVEGRWKALQASGLYERRAYLTEVYRNALAREVRGLGYEIEPRRDSKGKDHGSEIRGVSNELLEKYSVRSAQRDAAIEQFTVENGRKPTDNEVAVLVRESRAAKLAEISTEKVREQQQARLAPNERHTLQNLHANSRKQIPGIHNAPTLASESLQYAKEHLFERNSVVRDHELMTEALRHGRGQIDRGELRGALAVEQTQGGLIGAGNNLATRESLEREQRMIAVVDRGIGRYERMGGEREFHPSERLREEQQRAVHHVLDSKDFAINLRGAAGTGKTATLHEIDRGLCDAGREIVAVAPTRSAVEELRKVGFHDAMTISRLLEANTEQPSLLGKVLVVDEAGTDNDKQALANFYRNEFFPALTSVLDLGIELIRFDGQATWLGLIAGLLVDVFAASSEIDHLQAVNQAGDMSLPFARPAYEVYLGARVLATYAAHRSRLHFLTELLPRYVRILLPRRSEETRASLLFWPFRGALDLPDMKLGRNQEYWQQRVEETWGQVFGSEDAFLNAATQLEFILELNSFLLIQYRSPNTVQFRETFPEKRTEYVPDFWNTPLRLAIPTALRILELLVDKGFPSDLALEPGIASAVFEPMSKEEREIFYGEFLAQLKTWQDQTMMQQMRFPFLLTWPPRLQSAIDKYKSRQPDQSPRA